MLFTLAACSDDPAQNPDAGVTQDKGNGTQEGGAGDGKITDGPKKGDGKVVDAKPPKPDAKQPAHWVKINSGPQLTYPTATLLPNGDVLIAGGSIRDASGSDEEQKKAWRYQTAKGKFIPAGEMNEARTDHTATLLDNGKVLVVGGNGDKTYLAETELFDPKTMKWSQGPKMPQSRWAHAAVKLKNGWVLVTGGFGSSDSLASVTLYDPGSNSFKTPAKQMADERRYHAMSLLKSGKVLISGGLFGKSNWKYKSRDTTEIYDPNNGSFKAGPKMVRGRSSHTSTVRGDGTVLIVGGLDWNSTGSKVLNDLYDPTKNTMTNISYPASGLPVAHFAALLNDGRVLIVDYDQTVAFSPKMGGVWDSLPVLPDKRFRSAEVQLKNGNILVVAGQTQTTPYTLAQGAYIFVP